MTPSKWMVVPPELAAAVLTFAEATEQVSWAGSAPPEEAVELRSRYEQAEDAVVAALLAAITSTQAAAAGPRWTTEDGRVVSVCTMETTHLMAALRHLMRRRRRKLLHGAAAAMRYAEYHSRDPRAHMADDETARCLRISSSASECFEHLLADSTMAKAMWAELAVRGEALNFDNSVWR